MNKKGFTLVELLAVIAILAILVIIALPNVIGLFQDARRNSFGNEIRELYKQAQTQWTLDSYDISQTSTAHHYGANGAGAALGTKCTLLNMDGRQNIKYLISIDANGKVTKVQASDGTYQYEKTGTDIKLTEIVNSEIQAVADSGVTAITITCPTS